MRRAGLPLLGGAILAAGLCAPTGAVRAAGICADLDEGLAFIASPSGATVPRIGSADCAVYRTSTGKSLVCQWTHPYRSDAARAAFGTIAAEVRDCLPGLRESRPATGVSHPDTHEVLDFADAGATVRVSLKDKAARRETHVFLQIQRAE